MFLQIIGIIVGWVIIGAIINFIFYHNNPNPEVLNKDAKTAHILLNIITVIVLLSVIF